MYIKIKEKTVGSMFLLNVGKPLIKDVTLIFLGRRKSQSSSREPLSTLELSILTSYVLSGLTISVYKWVNTSSCQRNSRNIPSQVQVGYYAINTDTLLLLL